MKIKLNTGLYMTHGQKNIKLNTARFIMFSVITNIYNKKTKGHILMEF